MFVQSLLVACFVASTALASEPVAGDNWALDSSDYYHEQCKGGTVDGNNFRIPTVAIGTAGNSSAIEGSIGCPHFDHIVAERRFNNTYNNGIHQFSGILTINSMSGDRRYVTVKQTVERNSSASIALGFDKKGGRLYFVGNGETIAQGFEVGNSSVRINTIHDANIRSFAVYINGKEMYTNRIMPFGTYFFDKVGAYTTIREPGEVLLTWSNVELWKRVLR